MDQRLYVAACSGDIQALQSLLREDPFILLTSALANPDTPLHIASLLGYNDFARLIMTQAPELAKEFNRRGYSPIHLASLKGHLQIVNDLANVDRMLCLLKDSEGRTSLHCAVIKGRLDVIRCLVSFCPDSAKEVTFKGETVLHLAVKNSQGQIFADLISILKDANLLDELINCVDEDGNTALHLATYRNHCHIAKILRRDTNINVNAVNAEGHNASTILEIQNVYKQTDSTNINISPSKDEQANKQNRESLNNGLLVLFSLIATFCLEAILNLPGGIDGKQPQTISAEELAKFKRFLGSDVACFLVSVLAIFMVALKPLNYSYGFGMNSMIVGSVMMAALLLFNNVMGLATTDHLASEAFKKGGLVFIISMGMLVGFRVLFIKKVWTFLGKACRRLRHG